MDEEWGICDDLGKIGDEMGEIGDELGEIGDEMGESSPRFGPEWSKRWLVDPRVARVPELVGVQ